MKEIRIAIIGGSGIEDPGILQNPQEINPETPYGPISAPLVTGEIDGVKIIILARHGKGHVIMPTKVPYRANIWALKNAGATHIIATTACGSLKEEIRPGDLVFLDQFIDFTKHRNLSFYENFEEKIVHTPMAEPFCPEVRKILIQQAAELGLPHHPAGTIVTIEGPRFSTRAESRMFRQFGADAVNMSTVPEVILARELGICYSSIAMSTDYDCWRESEESVTWDMIVSVMKKNAENVKNLLLHVILKIGENDCANCR